MEGAAAAEVAGASAAGDAQIKASKENEQQQPSGSEALEMPATPLPRDLDWSEHFSFFNSVGGLAGSSDGARGTGLSNSESRPDTGSMMQRGGGSDDAEEEEERVEELTLQNCIAAAVQPEVSAGGSSSGSGDRPAVVKGLWGNFTRMAWRTTDVAGREGAAVSPDTIPNPRPADVPTREILAAGVANNAASRNNDVSSKDVPMSHGGNVDNNRVMTPSVNQQHLLSARPIQSEQQRAERENALRVSSFSNRLLGQMRSKTATPSLKAATPSSGVPGSPLKNSFKGKGVVYQGHAREEVQEQSNAKPRVPLDKIPAIPASTHDSIMAKVDPLLSNSGGNAAKSHGDGASLRELIKPGRQTMSKFGKMNLFKQILDLVDRCHAQGFTLQHLCPSYFTVTSSGQVKYIGSYTTQDLSTSIRQGNAPEDTLNRKRPFGHKSEHEESSSHGNPMLKYQKVGEQGSIAARRPIHTFRTDQRDGNQYEAVDPDVLKQGTSSCTVRGGYKFVEPYVNDTSCLQRASGSGNQQSTLEPRIIEESWYKSPEELSQSSWAFPSNIYSLGVLLFEV
jgi:protein suppressor of PHYA-105 1